MGTCGKTSLTCVAIDSNLTFNAEFVGVTVAGYLVTPSALLTRPEIKISIDFLCE